MTTFVDTSAFYAVLDRSDDHFEAAKRTWIDLIDGGQPLFTTNYVIVETLALLQHRIGMEAVRVFVADVLPLIQTCWIDETSHRIAVHSLQVSDRRGLSLVDCVSFEIMRERSMAFAFCFDSDFAEQGFQVVTRR